MDQDNQKESKEEQPSEVKVLRHDEEPKKDQSTGNFWLRNYNNLTEEDRDEMKADEIFALYLYRLSNRTNEHYWRKAALPFVILFRECLNEFGWNKKDLPESNQN